MNYFEIVRSYNEFLIAKRVGAKANSLFYALIGKCNTLRFPAKLSIYNSELRDLSGLSKDELSPARNKLTQVQVNDQYLVKYKSQGTRKPGDYWINYEGFVNYFQNEPVKDWSSIPTNIKPQKEPSDNKSENPPNSGANPNANHDTNDGVNRQKLIGKSDTLLTDCNEPNVTNKTAATRKANFFDSYMICFGRQPSPLQREEMIKCIDEDGLPEELVCYALEKASRNGKGYSYARSIMNDWAQKKIKTIAQADEDRRKFLDSLRKERGQQTRTHQEVVPEWMNKPKPDKPPEEEDPEAVKKRVEYLNDYLSKI
ncbi:DnaD domain-containing protein [Sporolactobacillus terrae]|uniref:DnaB/C C-terminal domain-containing protein n=1 Tax=Sporolactobacillus terrae TaxID=269673 RepID=A0A5K7WUV6_9BACL|nr:DnaD domain protein [Sporolactobacillus terrae]BBN97469.1 hypothetical protein St703_01740 [Sporolactobacillus terrae]